MKLTNVIAASLDGKIATAHLENDESRLALGFGSSADQRHVRKQIEEADAIITGANSMRASGGAWDQPGRGGKFPLWVVMSQSGLDPDLAFWRQSQIPRAIVSPAKLADFPDPSVEAVVYGDDHPAEAVLSYLKDKGAENVLLFGGGQINQLFYEKQLVDELKMTISPIIVGDKAAPKFIVPPLPTPVNLELVASHSIENHVFLSYRILRK